MLTGMLEEIDGGQQRRVIVRLNCKEIWSRQGLDVGDELSVQVQAITIIKSIRDSHSLLEGYREKATLVGEPGCFPE